MGETILFGWLKREVIIGKDFVTHPPLLKFEYQYLKKHVGWCQIFRGDDVVSGSLLPLHSGEAPNSVSVLSTGDDSRSKTLWDPVDKKILIKDCPFE